MIGNPDGKCSAVTVTVLGTAATNLCGGTEKEWLESVVKVNHTLRVKQVHASVGNNHL